jgi:hypothetical protein
MSNGTMTIPVPDLTVYKVRSMRQQKDAVNYLQAMINRWSIDKGTSIPNPIVLNKIVYYSAKAIHAKNPSFIIESGWFRYGPCFEEGRMFEDEVHGVSIRPVSKDPPRPEVAAACEEHVGKWNEWNDRDARFRGYLQYIYSEKCDVPKLKDYYIAKHELSCFLHELECSKDSKAEGTKASHGTARKDKLILGDLRSAIRRFDTALVSNGLARALGLADPEKEAILEFTGILYNYLRKVLDDKMDCRNITAFRNFLDQNVCGGISHLNYAMTFTTIPVWTRRLNHVQTSHRASGHDMLSVLPSQNAVFYRFV